MVRCALVAVLLVAATAQRAEACSVCGCGDPLVDVSDSVPREMRFRLALDFEVLSASAASDDDPAATESVTQTTLRPIFVYSPIDSLNLVVQLPLVRKAWTLTGGVEPDAATNNGVGDVDLGARWFFWRHTSYANMSRQELGVSAGVTAPTGADDALAGDGMRLDDHAQLGSGAWGPYAGLAYAYHADPWNLFASVTLHAHTTNSYGYHYATAAQWTARVDYRAMDGLALELAADGRYAGEDTDDGEAQTQTGGMVWSASPGVSLNVFGDTWLRARLQIPVVTVLNGEQTVGLTFFASAQVLIR